ncbi:hypothetical protein MMC34_007751 [Xylographa carneopallida]|nr:hypothetical protein [Xylographa carneopallida]
MKEFLPCDLQYAKVSLCPCGSSRGEEICTVHNKFVRWPVFGISPTDRAWSVHWPLLLPKSHIIEKVRLSKDLTIGSAHPKRKPISRTARLRALGAPLLYHEYIHPSVDLEENSYPALRGLTKDEMEALLKRDIQGHTCKMVLGVSENHIFDGCAIDFLNAYLLSLMEKIEQIILHSKLSLQTTGPGPMYVVPLFQDLAQTIVKSGLSGSTDHALTIVVPAFAASGLLPTAANPPPYCV